MSKRFAARLQANLSGGLPFEAKKDGTPRAARPLSVRKRTVKGARVLSCAQAETEDDHLSHVFRWASLHSGKFPQLGGRLCFHTPNENKDRVSRMQNARKGVKAGVVDVLNLRPSRGYTFFAGELKVRDGECSPEQSEFITEARAAGAFAHSYWCWSELCRAMLWYFCINDRLAYLSAGEPRDYLIPDLGGHDSRCGCTMKLSALVIYTNGTVYLKELAA